MFDLRKPEKTRKQVIISGIKTGVAVGLIVFFTGFSVAASYYHGHQQFQSSDAYSRASQNMMLLLNR